MATKDSPTWEVKDVHKATKERVAHLSDHQDCTCRTLLPSVWLHLQSCGAQMWTEPATVCALLLPLSTSPIAGSMHLALETYWPTWKRFRPNYCRFN